MQRIKHTYTCLALVILGLFSVNAFTQEANADSTSLQKSPDVTIRLSAGPAVIAIDAGYYLHNEILIDLSKAFGISFSYGSGNSYAGMKDVQRWYLPGASPASDDINRHQSLASINLGMLVSPLHTKKHRLYGGIGPGLNFYTFSEGSIVPYGNITVYKLSNKETVRMSINYTAGYDYQAFEHLIIGISFYGSQFTETLYSILLTAAYKF
jgi:hypothetical protein